MNNLAGVFIILLGGVVVSIVLVIIEIRCRKLVVFFTNSQVRCLILCVFFAWILVKFLSLFKRTVY